MMRLKINMVKCNLALISCLFVFSSLKVCAQNKQLINGEYKNLSFSQFADSIELRYAFHFYFDTTEINPLKINISANNFTIQQLLDKALQGTSLHYAVDSLNRVFITDRITVQTSLPVDVSDTCAHKDSVVTTMPQQDEEDPTKN